jgi:ribosomal protein L19
MVRLLVFPIFSASFAYSATKDIMRFVELRDAARLKALQSQQFVRPKPGDIVEVDFINLNLNNMNKTQKFKGICIEARKGLASSSFVLRCVIDEVGMQYR